MLKRTAALVVVALIAALAVTTLAAANTQLQAVVIAKGAKLHPGVVVTAPLTVRGHRVKRYQWERCSQSGKACKKITGATHRKYTLTEKDIGHRLRAALTLVNSTTVASGPTAVVGPPLPVNSVLPVVSDTNPNVPGQLTVGDTLTANLGTWTGALSYEWYWEDCDSVGTGCSEIAGTAGGPSSSASSQPSYVLTSSDLGHTLRLVVTAFNTVQT